MKPAIARAMLKCWGLSVAMLGSVPAGASPRQLGGGGDLGVSLGRIVIALIICSMAALIMALLIRRRMGRGELSSFLPRLTVRNRAIEVVETRRLSQHADICLVRSNGREYLLLLLAGAAQVLSDTATSDLSWTEVPAP